MEQVETNTVETSSWFDWPTRLGIRPATLLIITTYLSTALLQLYLFRWQGDSIWLVIFLIDCLGWVLSLVVLHLSIQHRFGTLAACIAMWIFNTILAMEWLRNSGSIDIGTILASVLAGLVLTKAVEKNDLWLGLLAGLLAWSGLNLNRLPGYSSLQVVSTTNGSPAFLPTFGIWFDRPQLLQEIALLLPFAIVSFIFLILEERDRSFRSAQMRVLILWGIWLTAGAIFFFTGKGTDRSVPWILPPLSVVLAISINRIGSLGRTRPSRVSAWLVVGAGAMLISQAISLLKTEATFPLWLVFPVLLLVAGIGFGVLSIPRKHSSAFETGLLVFTIVVILAPGGISIATDLKANNPMAQIDIKNLMAIVNMGSDRAVTGEHPGLFFENFPGTDPFTTINELQRLISTGKLHSVWDANEILPWEVPDIGAWLQRSCRVDQGISITGSSEGMDPTSSTVPQFLSNNLRIRPIAFPSRGILYEFG